MTSSKASNTGDANAPGGYANTGIHIGDINLVTGMPVRTRYSEQVRRSAPPLLIGREDELAELARFTTSPATAGTYQWWRAKAWSGKSALMSWFVLHPPPGVRIVSFFITARWASQNNRLAFIDNVMEQLLTILGQTPPPFLSEFNQETHLLGLLTEAAEACRDRGEHFVLLIDGLDEDRGVTTGPDAHSIAQLLPGSPPAGMRVIVAGRPNPPIPTDVPENHPLRDQSIVRPLTPSSAAEAEQAVMERELKNLLNGSLAEQDLLGLLTSAGGGLTGADLSELTGWSTWEVEDHLRSVTGRTFAQRGSHYKPGVGPDVYVLGHEELQVTATEMLGAARLAGYQQRLHTWADQYQARQWPANTPEYLLRGYHNLLTDTRDVPRIVAYATDPDRQHRLLDVSGGDVAAIAEINAVQTMLLGQDEPDLVALCSLALHRDRLTTRNTNIPVTLPALWILLGHASRASTLARSIPDRAKRDEALLEVVLAAAQTGDIRLAAEVASSIHPHGDRRRAVTILIGRATSADDVTCVLDLLYGPDPFLRFEELDPNGKPLTELTRKAISCGLGEEFSRRFAPHMNSTVPMATATLDLLAAATTAGEVEKSAHLVHEAADQARRIRNPGRRCAALTKLIVEATDVSREAGATRQLKALVDTAAQAAREMPSSDERPGRWLACVAIAVACAGHLPEATRLLDEVVGAVAGITHRGTRDAEAIEVVDVVVGHRRFDENQAFVTDQVPDHNESTFGYDEFRRTLPRNPLRSIAKSANGRLLRHVIGQALDLTLRIADPRNRDDVLVLLSRAVHEAGDTGLAAKAARQITDRQQHAEAATFVRDPQFLREATVDLQGIVDLRQRARVFLAAVRVATKIGDTDWAAGLVTQMVSTAREVPEAEQRDQMLATAASAAYDVRGIRWSREITQDIADLGRKAEAELLVTLLPAQRAWEAGDIEQALTFVAEAIDLAAGTGHVPLRDMLLTQVINTVLGQRVETSLAVLADVALAEFDPSPLASPLAVRDFGGLLYTHGKKRPLSMRTSIKPVAAPELITKAAEVARALSSPRRRTKELTSIAAATARAGHVGLGAEIARTVVDDEKRCSTLLAVAEKCDAEWAKDLLDEAIVAAHRIPERRRRDSAFSAVVSSAAAARTVDHGATAARAISAADLRRTALCLVLKTARKTGDIDAALRLASEGMAAARAISGREQQSQALTSLVEAMLGLSSRNPYGEQVFWDLGRSAEHGGRSPNQSGMIASLIEQAGVHRMTELIAYGGHVAESIPDPNERSRMLVSVARAAFDAGDIAEAGRLTTLAERVARFTPDPVDKSQELTAVASTAVTTGCRDEATRLIDWAERTAREIPDAKPRCHALISLATVVGHAGDTDRALALIGEVESTARREFRVEELDHVLESVVEAAVEVGGRDILDRAEVIARSVVDPTGRGRTMTAVAAAAFRVGETGRAARLITRTKSVVRATADPHKRTEVATSVAQAMIRIVGTLADAGEFGRAAELLSRVEKLARYVTDSASKWQVVSSIVAEAARLDDLDRAESLARLIGKEPQRSWSLRAVAEAAIRLGDLGRAAHVACAVQDVQQRNRALRQVVDAVGRTGEIERAERMAQRIEDPYQRQWALRSVVLAAATRDRDRAAELLDRMTVDGIPGPPERTAILAGMATAALSCGDTARAMSLLENAKETALSSDDEPVRRQALASIVKALVDWSDGHPELATFVRELTEYIPGSRYRVHVLRSVIQAVAPTAWLEEATLKIADSREQCDLLVLLAKKSDPVRAKRVMARVVTLERWHVSLRHLATMWTEMVPAVTENFISTTRWDADAAKR